jgi:hypothetical protein
MPEAFNRNSVALSTTNITDAYQAPNIAATDRAIVISCLVANVNGTSPIDVSMTISDSANTQIARIASTVSVPADASLELIPNKLVLKRGEKLRATAGTANGIEVTVSALEITT